MDLISFLNRIDRLTEDMDETDLRNAIREIARKTAVDDRDKFIGFFDKAEQEHDMITVDSVIEELQVIQDQQYTVGMKMLDMTRSWYEGFEEDSDYDDPHRICETVEKVCAVVGKCVDERSYAIAVEMFKFLDQYKVRVKIDEDTVDELGLEELIAENLIHVDLTTLRMDFLYALYMSTPQEERAQALFDYMSRWASPSLKLENVLQQGDQEPDHLKEFYADWIALLQKSEGVYELDLLIEALRFEDQGRLPQVAKEYCNVHPGLYVEEIQDADDDEEIMAIVDEALERIDEKYVIRSEIALEGARSALRKDMQSKAESYYLKALASDTSFVNYIRLITEAKDPSRYDEDIKQILDNVKAREGEAKAYGELAENQLQENVGKAIEFMQGDITATREYMVTNRRMSGWTGTYMNIALPLVLMYLYEGELKSDTAMAMASTVCNALSFLTADYQKGTLQEEEINYAALFLRCMDKWKQRHPMRRNDKARLLNDVDRIIDKRTAMMLSRNVRSKYNECASLIAMQGEVEESLGVEEGRQALLAGYRRKYYRHYSFHSALKTYGMREI
jgi:hypothetical protein